jgi:hypothetical protein
MPVALIGIKRQLAIHPEGPNAHVMTFDWPGTF